MQDLGSDLGNETLIIVMGEKSTLSVNDIFDSIASTSYLNERVINEQKRIELFHVRVVIKHTKVETLFDSGSCCGQQHPPPCSFRYCPKY